MRAKDAHHFYYNHPDIALKDWFTNNNKPLESWEDIDSYTLASIYSEDVKHEFFNPVSDQALVWEMDKLNALREAGGSVDPKEWAALAATLFITFGPDGGSGGGGGGLDDEINKTLKLIDAGGPFPFKQDGQIFQNREGLLPAITGDYHEYTVITPGVSNRGTVRIVTGPNGKTYLTLDHYQTFIRIR